MCLLNYKLQHFACVLLCVSAGCARPDARRFKAQEAQDASVERDAGADKSDAAEKPSSRASSARADAGGEDGAAGAAARDDNKNKDAGKANDKDKAAGKLDAAAGSGGVQSVPSHWMSSQPETAGASSAGRDARAETRDFPSAGTVAPPGGTRPSAAGAPGAGGNAADNGDSQSCGTLARACAVVAEHNEHVQTCLNLGMSDDASACRASAEDCHRVCGAALCRQLADNCRADEQAASPLHDCQALGMAGDVERCFSEGAACLELCTGVAP